MELTRRDALRSLAAAGIVGASLTLSELVEKHNTRVGEVELTDADVATASAVADVIYPSEVDASSGFVDTYFSSLNENRRARTAATAEELRTWVRREFGADLPALSRSEGDAALRSLGVGRVQSQPDGTLPERVRYYLVNSLLYALFTSPRGSSRLGIDNPRGYPGGFATYRTEVERRRSK